MIIDNLDIECISIFKFKTQTPFFIDAYAILLFAVAIHYPTYYSRLISFNVLHDFLTAQAGNDGV